MQILFFYISVKSTYNWFRIPVTYVCFVVVWCNAVIQQVRFNKFVSTGELEFLFFVGLLKLFQGSPIPLITLYVIEPDITFKLFKILPCMQ